MASSPSQHDWLVPFSVAAVASFSVGAVFGLVRAHGAQSAARPISQAPVHKPLPGTAVGSAAAAMRSAQLTVEQAAEAARRAGVRVPLNAPLPTFNPHRMAIAAFGLGSLAALAIVGSTTLALGHSVGARTPEEFVDIMRARLPAYVDGLARRTRTTVAPFAEWVRERTQSWRKTGA